MTTERRRRYSTEWARQRRAAALATAMVGAATCPKRWGNHPCGGPLLTETDGDGRTGTVCAWCERHRRGLCLECPNRIRGRSKRCEGCKAKEAHRARLRFYGRHCPRLLAKMRVENARPEVSRRKALYKRVWRKLHPDLVRAQKRRESLRQPRRIRDYMRRYRARHRGHYRRLERLRYYRLHPQRPDPHCVECAACAAYRPRCDVAARRRSRGGWCASRKPPCGPSGR